MSSTIKDGGQAFPRPAAWSPSGMTGSSAESGMSLRQYYAAHAPVAPDWFRFEPDNLLPTVPSVPQGWDTEQRAEFLMLKEGSIDEACAKPEVRDFWRSYSAAREKLEAWRMDMRKRKFFAWRWEYSDMMIATERGDECRAARDMAIAKAVEHATRIETARAINSNTPVSINLDAIIASVKDQ